MHGSQQSSSASVRISDEAVSRFVALTGDCSSLHVSDSFARRSAYRRPIAHGMLPIALLPLHQSFRRPGQRCVPRTLTGRFVSPVFIGDALRLTVTPTSNQGSGGSAFDFHFDREDSGAPATTGTLVVAYEASAASRKTPHEARGGMLGHPVELQHFLLEQISTGDVDTLDFSITSRTIDEYAMILAAAGDVPIDAADLAAHFVVENLLSAFLFSTSVGVLMPGASATFLEFSAQFDRPVALETNYRLQARVAHRSTSTRIVKKEMLVTTSDGDQPIVTGRVAVLVNKPSQRMPTMSELRVEAGQLGIADKVALVTGASRGIGETTAKLLAVCGARVVVNYHRGADDAARIVAEIEESGGQAIAVKADVSSPAEVEALVQAVLDRYGAIDVLVNNAARDYRPIPFQTLTWDEIQKDLDVIVKGTFLCCQRVIPSMLERGSGKIINISSIATDNPPADQAKYVIAKSALVGLTRSLAVELASKNIQVNIVVPNFVETDLVAHIPDGFRRKIAQETPMRRNASPVDVARAVLMLASSYTSFTTGQRIMVTGGSVPYL